MSNLQVMGDRCAFCGRKPQYEDPQTGQVICLIHGRLTVRASGFVRKGGELSALSVRPATPADLQMIRTLALYFWKETEMECFDTVYDMLTLPSLLICEGEKVVGCLTYSEDLGDDALTLVMLNILPGYNGRGGGRALLAVAETLAREKGLGRLRVATSNDNLLGLYFYQRAGFVITGVKVNAIKADSDGDDLQGFAGIPIRDEIQLERLLR